MKNDIHYYFTRCTAVTFLMLSLLLMCPILMWSQQTVVLPHNGSVTQESCLQGGLRYQRQLYLLTPAELDATALTNGMVIDAIGFTIASPQDTSTEGLLKIYLQNTTNTASRKDTNWTTVSVGTNSYTINPLIQGDYEWQVRATCTGNSAFSPIATFSNADLSGCNTPEDLYVDNVTDVSLTLHWYAPNSPGFVHYLIQYKSIESNTWSSTTTTSLSKNLTGLVAGKLYQWSVQTICSGGVSQVAGSIFQTNNADVCNEPGGTSLGPVAASTARLRWVDDPAAIRYDILYRRLNTTAWFAAISFPDSTLLTGLASGTNYEWRVRSVCNSGTGSYVSGPNFMTTGTAVCYPPSNQTETNLTDTTVTLNWVQSSGAVSYELRYRLRNAISWTNAFTPMTLVHNDTTILPETTGDFNIPFAGTGISSFTYTGGGLYIAWEYTNADSATTSFNSSLATTEGTVISDELGLDSVIILLCLNGIGDTSHATVLLSNRLRPETRLGSGGLTDMAEVTVVYTTGYQASPNGNPAAISALIRNFSSTTQDFDVTLTVTEKNSNTVRFTEMVSLEVADSSSAVAYFSDWAPVIMEDDLVTVSIPAEAGENVTANNSSTFCQTVNPKLLSYSDDGSPVTSAGLDTSAGLILVRHQVSGCTKINSARIYLTNSSGGHEVYAVVLGSDTSILSTSVSITPDSSQTNNWYTFYFTNPPVITDDEFYIGLAQSQDNTNGYSPVGVQWETNFVREDAYFRAELDGDNLMDHPSPGRLMIRAELLPGFATPIIEGDLTLCEGDTNTLSIASFDGRYASSVINYSSQFSGNQYSASQALGSPDVYPSYGTDPGAWTSASFDGQREYLHLGYADAAPVNRIIIYETSSPGAVDSVYVKNPNTNNFVLVYSNTAAAQPLVSRALTIDFAMTAFNISEIRIALASNTVAGFNAIDAVAIGQYDSTPSYSAVSWSPNGETTNSISATEPGEYTVEVTDGSGCEGSASAIVITPDGTVPVISANGPTNFCPGGSVMLTSNQPTGNTWSTGATTQSIVVVSSGSYHVSFDDGTGCGSVNSNTINVTVHSNPSPVITGDPQLCPGGTTTIGVGIYSSYSWSTGATTQSIIVSQTGSYSVTVTNSNGCTGSTSVSVIDAPELNPTITGDLDFCLGTTTVLNAGSHNEYDWSTGATTQTIIVNAAGYYSVTVTDLNGCSGAANVETITFTPPSPSITGDAGFCPGDDATMDAGAGYVTYAWSGGGSARFKTAAAAGSYTVTVTDANGCTGTDSQTIAAFTPPVPAIAGTLSFCAGSATQLDAGPGYLSYAWSNGDVSQSTLVTTVGTFTVTVTDSNGCTGTDSATTTEEGSLPDSPGPITGPTSGLCGDNGVVYSIAPVDNAAFYVWTLPDGVTLVSGEGTTSITVNFSGSFTSGEIVVAASNACGQSGSIDPTFIIVTGTPGMPGPITGPTFNVCPGDVVNFSTTSVVDATSYTWTVPANATITSGQGTLSISVTIQNGFNGGSVCVKAVNSCGESAPRCINIVNGDQDNDGDPDCLDNCPFVYNPNQRDRDNDGLGDVCDPCNNNQSGGPCNDGDACTTNDVYDASCVCHGTFQDSDNDGVCNAQDQCPGFDDDIDSDGDSVADGCDECPGFDDFEDDNNNGIPDGCDNCTVLSVNAGTCKVVYRGWNPLSCTNLTANPLSGTAPFTYLWSTGGNSQTINVCPIVNTVYTVTVTDAGGCTGTDVVTVEVVDVRCGPNNADVKVCHSGITQCVKANKVQLHLNHGDALGDCGINPCSGIYAFVFPGDFMDHDAEELMPDHMNEADETELLEDISVYPNPATNEFIIQCISNSDVTVKWRMVDMQGREMMNDNWNVIRDVNIKSINVSGITPGLYLIQVMSGDIHFQTKLVIAR